jgi:D-beta-D-heptose 7-phosphate kinase/D-beta-D-heptose 1-phosphate adenosyltransferase
VIGDACVDTHIYTSNTRTNPEAPTLLLNAINYTTKYGMTMNVVDCLMNLGIGTYKVLPPKDQWGNKVRLVDKITKAQILRMDTEAKVEPFCNYIASLNSYDAVVISDYNKGFITYDTLDWFCDKYKGPIFLDTKKKDIYKYSRCYIKINEHEANLADKVSNSTIVTMGASGVTWYGEQWPAYKTKLVDVCGAGDAFLAGLVYGYLTNTPEMLEYGIVNAGISVEYVGTYAPSLKELIKGKYEYDIQCRQS